MHYTTDANRRTKHVRMPRSTSHTDSWGALRRCVAQGCSTAFTTKRYCPSCDNPTLTIAEARRLRDGA